MLSLWSNVLSLVVGFVTGLLVSIPVGPINVTIVNEGARRGFRWAMMIGLGAVAMETIYCALGFAGFSSLFDLTLFKAIMELLSFLLMAFLGFKYLLATSLTVTSPGAEKVEERLHPHSAFGIGFVRVLVNPAVLLMWVTLAATFISHEWVSPNWRSKLACILGVALGAATWFFLLSYAVSLKHNKMSTSTLVRMSKISGAFLLAFAVVLGARLVMLLAQQEQWLKGPN